MSKKTLDIVDILQRSLALEDEVTPLIKYLGIPEGKLELKPSTTRADADKIIAYLCQMGSNDVATALRLGGTVSYHEVVYDVACKLNVKGASKDLPTEENEKLLIEKLFADAFDKMSDEEKSALLASLELTGAEIPYGATGTFIMQLLIKKFGGFSFFKTSVYLANAIARAILGRGLTFAANAALTRYLGLFLGPVGWIATGSWLALDLAGPAFRKTIPAVVHLAMLRQMITTRMNIGIVGEGSVGKDALLKAVFGVDTANVNPVAGSTSKLEIFPLGDTGTIHLVNFPGGNDVRQEVNDLAQDHIYNVDVFLLVVDLSRGVSGSDVKTFEGLQQLGRPVLVCLNKVDMVRPANQEPLIAAARERLVNGEFAITAFDPDDRLHDAGPIGADDVFDWVKAKLEEAGKETGHLTRGNL